MDYSTFLELDKAYGNLPKPTFKIIDTALDQDVIVHLQLGNIYELVHVNSVQDDPLPITFSRGNLVSKKNTHYFRYCNILYNLRYIADYKISAYTSHQSYQSSSINTFDYNSAIEELDILVEKLSIKDDEKNEKYEKDEKDEKQETIVNIEDSIKDILSIFTKPILMPISSLSPTSSSSILHLDGEFYVNPINEYDNENDTIESYRTWETSSDTIPDTLCTENCGFCGLCN